MAVSKELVFKVGADPDGAIKGFGQISNAAKREMGKVSDELADGESKGKQYARALGGIADELDAELTAAQRAASKLGDALGPELRAKLGSSGIDRIVTDARRAGLAFEDVEEDAEALADAVRRLDRVGARIEIEADAEDAKGDLDRVQDDLRQLDGDSAKVAVEADAEDAKGDLDRVGDALRKLDGDSAKVNVDSGELDGVLSKLDDLGGGLGDIAGALHGGGGIVAGVGAVGAGLFAAAENAADLAVEAKTTSTLTGDSVENASRLQAVWQTSGADINDLNDVLLQMHGVLADNPELAKQLGLNLNDGATIGERFRDVVQKVGAGMVDARTQSQLFGEEGVRQVARLTTVINGDLEGALADVSETRIISDDDVDAAIEFKRSMSEVSSQVSSMAAELGQTVMPMISELLKASNAPVGDTSFWEMVANNPLSDGLRRAGAGFKFLSESAGESDAELRTFWTSVVNASTGAAGLGDAAGGAATKMEHTRAAIVGAGDAAQVAADQQMAALADQTGALTELASGLASQLDEVFGSQVDLQGSSDALAANFDELETSIRENGASLDQNTEKGRANREQIRQNVSGIQTYISKLIESGASNEQAGAEYATLRGQLVRQVTQFGVTEAAANAYIDQLGLTPNSVNTAVNLNNVSLARDLIRQHISQIGAIPADKLTSIMTAADTGALDSVKRSLASLERNVIVRVQTIATGGAYSPPGVNRAVAGGGDIQGMAGGGVFSDLGRDMTWVGENGPEAVRLPIGSHVYKNNESRAMGASSSIVVNVNNNGRDLTGHAVAMAIRQAQLAR